MFEKDNRHQLGKDSEQLAVDFLQKNGYTIIQRNFRIRGGEIDIIAKEKNTLVFIEVKSRTTTRYGHAIQSLTSQQQKRLSKTALTYLYQHKMNNQSARFDVVAIQKNQYTGTEIRLIRNAFEFFLTF
jgi:putative endonuclease